MNSNGGSLRSNSDRDGLAPGCGATVMPTIAGPIAVVATPSLDMVAAVEGPLTDAGCRLVGVDDGSTLLSVVDRVRPDIVLVAVDLPGVGGVEVCRLLRRRGSTVPVALLAPVGESGHHLSGLEAGADDMVTMPIPPDELLARIRALLRRGGFGTSPVVTVGDIEFDTERREVRRAGQLVSVTLTEFAILELLLRNADIVLERTTMYERIWGIDLHRSSKSLDVHIGALRRKLEHHGDRVIHNVRAVGFVVWSGDPRH